MDLTGLIGLSELYNNNENNFYVYLHDTCIVGENFFNKINQIDLTNVSSIRINRAFSMNIGIYKQKLINSCFDFLQSFKNKDDNKLLDIKLQLVFYHCGEDVIFNKDPTNFILDNYFIEHRFTGPTDYYNTGTMRIVEHYQNIDIYKIKGNWGQGTWTLNP